MDMILPIILGAMILASFIVAYMSAKTWQVYQVVLVVFIFLGTVTFFYMGARTLATHKSWGELVRRLERETSSAEQQALELVGGEQNAQGQAVEGELPQLRKELAMLVGARGGALFNVAVDSVKDGTAQLSFKTPDHGLIPNMVLFAFDEVSVADGGSYLGEFKVVTAAEASPTVQIAPNLPLTDSQLQRLAAAKGPWTLYSTMPIDNPVLFAGFDDATRQSLLPKESLTEFADGQRKLRDYELFFHESFVQRSLLNDLISTTTNNIQRTEAAVQETNREIGYRDAEKVSLKSDLEKFQYEVQAIANYQKALEAKLAEVRQSLKATYLANNKLAAALTAGQMRAAEEIDQRTESPADSTP